MKNAYVQLINTINSASIRYETIDGAEHMIIPSTTLPDNIVMNGGLYQGNEIAAGYKTLEGTPAPIGHPHIDGKHVSAKGERARNAFGIGAYNRNVTRKNGIVHAEKVVPMELAKATKHGRELIEAVNKGLPIHSSTGLNLQREKLDEPMTVNGKEYTWIARNLQFDHDAILINEPGAATPEDGVGLMVNSDESESEIEFFTCNISELNEKSDDEKESFLNSIISGVANALKPKSAKEEHPMQLVINALKDKGIETEGLSDIQLLDAYNEMMKPAESPANADVIAAAVNKAIEPLTAKIESLEEAQNASANAEHDKLAEELSAATGIDVNQAKAMDDQTIKTLLANSKSAAPVFCGFSAKEPREDDFDINAAMEGK